MQMEQRPRRFIHTESQHRLLVRSHLSHVLFRWLLDFPSYRRFGFITIAYGKTCSQKYLVKVRQKSPEARDFILPR